MEESWEFLVQAGNDIEAEIVCGYLKEQGIPSRRADSSPYTGAMRVIGGLAYEIEIFVPAALLEEARNCLALLENEG